MHETSSRRNREAWAYYYALVLAVLFFALLLAFGRLAGLPEMSW